MFRETKIKMTLLYIIIALITTQFTFAKDNPVLKVGDAAPTFFLKDIEDGKFFMSRALKEKKPIVISFFANWCIPCRTEIPLYEKMFLSEELSDVTLVYVHVSEPRQPKDRVENDITLIKQVEADLGMTHPILYDRYGVVAEKYGATSLPTSVVIGPKGVVEYYHTGFQEGDEADLKKVLMSLK